MKSDRFEIALSSGMGKGGKNSRTGTVQVREPIRKGEYLLRAQFRYERHNKHSLENATKRAWAWIFQHDK